MSSAKYAPPAPIQVSSSALAHQAAVRFYNDQLKRQAAAKGLNTANLPYAAPTTAPDDLMTLARPNGVDFGGSAPAEQGLHSGSGAVDPFNRPKPSTSQPQSQQTSSTASSSSVDPQRMAGIVAGGLNPGDPAGAVASRVLMPSTAPTTSDGTPIAPHLTQILQTPLPPDVAQTVLAQNRSAAGGITGLAAPVPLTGPTSIPTYGNGTATFAADMAARRAPGGSPYGMVPVDPTTQGQTYVGDGKMTFNGQVLPAGQTLTLLPNGRKIYGQAPAAQPSTPTSTASAPASAPAGHVAATLGSSYPTTPQGVAAADRNAQASPAGGAPQAQLPAWIAGMTDPATLARGGASAPASTTAPSGSVSPGTAAALAVRAGIGNAGQAVGDTLNSARDAVRTGVDTAASNTADFGSTLLGLPSASPATRNAGVDAVNSYAANNPTMASLVNVPKTPAPPASPSNMAGGYDLSAYALKPPGTTGTAVASTPPAAPAPAPAAPQATAPTAAPATGSPSIVANKGLLANAGIGTGTPLPAATSTNPLFVPTPSPQVNVNGTPASLAGGLPSTTPPAPTTGGPQVTTNGVPAAPQQLAQTAADAMAFLRNAVPDPTLPSLDPNAGADTGPGNASDDEKKREEDARIAAALNQKQQPAPPSAPTAPSQPAAQPPAFTTGAAQTLASAPSVTDVLKQVPGYGMEPASRSAQAAALGKSALYQPGQPVQRNDNPSAPITDAGQALNRPTDASQNLARPGQQTNTGGPVSDADSQLNRRTDADQALNPDKPQGSVTPGAGNGLLNAGSNLMPGYVDQMRNQAASLDSSSPLTLGNTATNDGSTSLNGQPPADHVSSVLGDYATPAGVAQSGPGSPSLTPRTTVPNPGVVGATPGDPNTPLGDDEEMVNGVRRKKLQSSTAPAPPGPTSDSTNSSAPAAPSGSDS